MKALTTSLAAAGLLLFASHFTLQADEWDKLTKLTFSGPVQIPGQTLPAGTYTIKLLDSPGDRNIVEVYNDKQTQLLAIMLAVPDERLRPRGKTVVQFAERPSGQPEALKAWFYPGSTVGEQFVYPYSEARTLAKESNEPVYATKSDLTPYSKKHMKAGDEDSQKMKHSSVIVVQPNGQESDVNSSGTNKSR